MARELLVRKGSSRITAVVIGILVSLGALTTGKVLAHDGPALEAHNHRAGDLFPSYWAPAAPGVISAPLYVAPVPTPPYVGHTWVTYQPLYPHELLYPHKKVYWRKNPQGGWTRVSVCWW